MYCPDCGMVNELDQNFCRGCGFVLKDISEALQSRRPPPVAIDRRLTTLATLGKVALYGVEGLSVLGIGAFIYSLVRTMVLWDGFSVALTFMILAGIVVLLMITFAVFSSVIAIDRRYLSPKALPAPPPANTAELELDRLPPLSVSENTTQKLE